MILFGEDALRTAVKEFTVGLDATPTKRSMCAVVMMQFFPFVDKEAVGLLSEFERAVYAAWFSYGIGFGILRVVGGHFSPDPATSHRTGLQCPSNLEFRSPSIRRSFHL